MRTITPLLILCSPALLLRCAKPFFGAECQLPIARWCLAASFEAS